MGLVFADLSSLPTFLPVRQRELGSERCKRGDDGENGATKCLWRGKKESKSALISKSIFSSYQRN